MSDSNKKEAKPKRYINIEADQRQISYTTEDVERWYKEGKMPSHLRNYHFKSLEREEKEEKEWEKLHSQIQEFKEKNPSATQEDINKFLGYPKSLSSDGEDLISLEEKYSQEFFDFIFENQKLLEVDIQPQEDKATVPELFRDTDHTKIFRVTKAIMDRIYHLPTLLEKARLEHIHKTSYRITSSLLDEKENEKSNDQKKIQKKPGSVGQVSISYDFIASSKEEAQKIFEDYKHMMRGEGIKTLMAYWKNACLKGRFVYHTPLIEVMRHISNENRESAFSVKDKTNFWRITRLIENTKLNIVVGIPIENKKRNKKYRSMSFEFRLLEVEATQKTEREKAYPNETIIRVLDTAKFQTLSQIGTSIKNETLNTHYQDVLLAVSLQTRKAQTQDKHHNTYDEDFLIERANLSNTAKKNKSVARSKLKRKLESFKEDRIIESYEKSGDQYIIEISNQKEIN